MMGGISKKMLIRGRKFFAAVSIFVLVVSGLGDALVRQSIPRAEAAQATIDANANAIATAHIQAGTQTVFIDDQTGYKFYVDAPGYCVYRKTTDGGTSWSASTTVDSQPDCTAISVWYDRWTPGDTGNYIHIATLDTSVDDIFYNRLDTNGDNLLFLSGNPVDVSTNSTNSIVTVTAGANFVSITKGTDGTIYTGTADASDSYVVECSASCNLAASWTETGRTPFGLLNDYIILLPLAGGSIMAIQRMTVDTANDIRSIIWNNSTWNSTTTIDANAPDNTLYDVGMAATVSSTTPGNVYLAYIARNATLGTDDQVRGARYNGSSWATTTDIVNSTTRGLTNVAIGLDAANDDVYVAYSGRTNAATSTTGNAYWKYASSSMMNWSSEVGPINTSADDIYGLDLNIQSDQRIFASWFASSTDDILGNTIADIFPGVHASGSGTQISSVAASTTNVYIGGKFLLYDTYKTHDISGITITESGTIDAENAIENIKLYYELDTTAPYNCASESYGGSESQFGSTDNNGFSGANGVSSFSGTTETISTTTSLCIYPVMDIKDSALSSSTIDISIDDPVADITVDNGTAGPPSAQNIASSTLVYNDTATQVHFHFRNDDGNEAAATSRTSGVADTALSALRQGSTTRLRMEVSNEGSSSTPPIQYRLEYGVLDTACSAVTSWTDVGASGGDFDMFDTANLLDGGNTTNIAVGIGGVADENTTFLSPNAAVKDTSSQTASITLSTSQYVEFEYSIQASSTAPQGNTYCFRLTNQGNSLSSYLVYPSLTINADVAVAIATSSQKATTTITSTNFYVESAFTVTENTSSRNVTSITLTETGTVDAQNGLDNIKLYYDQDTTAPYNCADQAYAGGESQFGATDTDGFSGANGSSTFSGSVAISTTSTLCLYTVLDVTSAAQNGETINLTIQDPSAEVLVSGGGSVSPSTLKDLNGSTTLVGAILTQTHYHWRNDNGTEAAATSLSGGVADTAITNVAQTTPVRLRMQVSNEGTISSPNTALRIEYGPKISTCSAIGTWTDVGESGGAWNMATSSNLTDAANTTDIADNIGGMTNENTTFLTPNSAVKESSSTVATTTLSSTQFIEAEFSIKQTASAGNDITYCFRLTNGGTALNAYTTYAELTTSPERDFEIQRNFFTIATSSTSTTLTAGVDYVAPSASTSAFIRITNIAHTGAGHNNGTAGAQNATNTTVYIVNPSNIMNSVTFARTGVTNNTRVSWEIIEFIGTPGSDNEMIVRSQSFIQYATASTSATTSTIAGIVDDADVVVFITGQQNNDIASTNYDSGLSTSAWATTSDRAYFWRGSSGTDANRISYAVVEFKGPNWFVQRASHTYTAAGITETENITAVGSLSKTFIHTQKRNNTGLNGTDEFGAEVWLSSIGVASFVLQTGATTPSGQTSVAWIIENTQSSSGAMNVLRGSGSTNVTPAPLTISVSIGATLSDITNSSIFLNARSSVAGTTFPRAQAGVRIASTTHYEIWRSNTGSTLTYRTEIVEWPTAGLAVRQNYFGFYEDNNALLPTVAWPGLNGPLGENEVLTGSDNPLGEGERIRIRMSLRALNATLPAGTKAFKLQYAPMVTTCSAISAANWTSLGNSASSTVWRGYNATGTTDGTILSTDPPTGGDLLLTSVSDVAGTYEEVNDTSANTYAVPEGDDIEYDWLVEQNGASAETYYCFRMVESDGAPLDSYSSTYPQLRTASFTPRTQNWRWYDDELNATPTTTLASENVAPIDILNEQIVKLRITVKEIKNISRDDVRFKLQYSEQADFSIVGDVLATSTCIASSTWCYANGGGVDNAKISTSTLSDVDTCLLGVGNGCGTHNESSSVVTGFRHEHSAATEYEFTLKSVAPRVNRVYYFRLFDTSQDIPVTTNTGESYPSLVTKGATLVFSVSGIPSATLVEGVTTDITTTATLIPFGTVPIDTFVEGAYNLTIDSNGTEGYQVLMKMNSNLLSASGGYIKHVSSTNAVPAAWATGCNASSTSCFGYHSGDDTLQGASSARFFAPDTYASVSTSTPEEVAYSSVPAVSESTDVVFRLLVRQLQDAGQYESSIQYISVPMF